MPAGPERADRPSSGGLGNPSRGSLPPGNQAGLPERLAIRTPSPEERRRMREEILGNINLTAEQRKEIDAIYKQQGDSLSPEVVRQRIEAVGRILTPAQRDAAAKMMRQRIRTYIGDRLKMLPPEERKKFMQKLDERFEQRRREIEGAIAAPAPTPRR